MDISSFDIVNIFLDFETKGYIRKLSESDINIESNKIWYLLHFGITNPNKIICVVFDAFAKKIKVFPLHKAVMLSVFCGGKLIKNLSLTCTKLNVYEIKVVFFGIVWKIFRLETKGYIRKLSESEINIVSDKIWYLLHFEITNPNKLRVVFDISAKIKEFPLSIFITLYKMLMNFRTEKYAFTADIREIFLQVRVRPQDCHA